MGYDLNKKVKDFVLPIRTVLQIDQTVEEAANTIRSHGIAEKIFYFYVVDQQRRLKGVVSARHLLLSPPNHRIESIMENAVVSIPASQTLRQAMEKLSTHHLLALPVVDEEGLLLGIVDIQLYLEEAIDMSKARSSNADVFQILGFKIEEGKTRSVWSTYKNRMPWLFCNMLGGIACAIISHHYALVLGEVLLLAFFIPLVLTLSESISMQSMTNSLHLLQRDKATFRTILQRMALEWKLVSPIALTCGAIIGAVSLFWGDGLPPAFVIGVGILISVTLSGTIGAIIPLCLHAAKLDPRVAAGPVVLMAVDIITTAIYLSIATALLI